MLSSSSLFRFGFLKHVTTGYSLLLFALMASFYRNNIHPFFISIFNNLTSTLNSANTRPQAANQSHAHQSRSTGPHTRSTNRPPEQTNPLGPHNWRGRTRSGACNSCSRQPQPPPPHTRQFRQQPEEQASMNSNTGPSNTNANSANKIVDKFDIQDVRDPNDIKSLSALQLKTILTRNCIDFKGVFEKEVLREKVMQLWLDHNSSKQSRRTRAHDSNPNNRSQDDGSDEIDENQLCKICMEREINCVLLECGHYLTCVTCGRKLAECPICRQNVTRCVRTFRG